FLAMLPQLFIGIGARIAFPELASGDQALTSVLTLIPPVVGAIAVTGVIAASMSTADSQFLVLSSLITKDFYVNILNPKSSNKKRLRVARISMFLLLLLAFLVSLKPPKLIVTLSILSFAGTLQILPTMLGGLFWRRATKEGAISSMLVGVLTLSIFQWVLKPPLGIHQGIWGLIFGSLTFVLVSLVTKPPEEKALKILGYLKEALGGLEDSS
ncbi:MAG: sodium:solute symporter family protein, partial [Candidatus Methanofastidiosia archaeon]